MNPGDLAGQVTQIALILCAIAAVVIACLRVRSARRAGFRKGLLAGLNAAFIHYGEYRKGSSGLDLHGFATECEECNRIAAYVIGRREEYFRCGHCGSLQPAPLPAPDPVRVHYR